MNNSQTVNINTLKAYFKRIPLLMVSVVFTLMACQNQENTTKAEYKKLTEAVYASGNILPANDHQLFSEASGFVVKQLVKEGDEVKKGQVLFIIQSTQQDSRTHAAKAAYEVAKLNSSKQSPVKDELQIALFKAKTKLQNDSINYFRQKKLYDKQATSKVQFEQASLNYQISKSDIQRIQTQLKQTENRLLVEMKNAESQFLIQSDEQRNHQVVSDMDGIVYEVYKNQGELIRRNEPVALVGGKGDTYIQLAVDELDVNKLKIGQAILMKVDVFPNQTFEAKVSKIYPMMDQRDQSFRVDANFVEGFQAPYAGLNVEANIIIHEKENALVLPKTVLSGSDSLWILNQNGERVRIGIEKGAETMEYVEIRSGLDTNTKILLNQ